MILNSTILSISKIENSVCIKEQCVKLYFKMYKKTISL